VCRFDGLSSAVVNYMSGLIAGILPSNKHVT
jgi:hypothetical protein